MKLVHSELELGGDGFGCLYQPLCENQRGVDPFSRLDRDVEMTPDERFVTCTRCLEALGYAGDQIVDVERGVAPDSGNPRIAA